MTSLRPSVPEAEPAFAGVLQQHARFVAADPDYASQLVVRHRGVVVVDSWQGPGVGAASSAPVFSVTKGISGICIALLVQRGLLDPDQLVSSYWPEFGRYGKERMTVSQLLSHRGGLPEVDGLLSRAELLDDLLAEDRLAAQRPYWEPGVSAGYHAFTMGSLIAILIRRITGLTMTRFFDTELRIPHGLDVRIGYEGGIPEAEQQRMLTVESPSLTNLRVGLYDDIHSIGSVGALTTAGRPGLERMAFDIPGDIEVLAAGPPGAGGVASAYGLAATYSIAVSGMDGSPPLLDAETIARVGQIRWDGVDLNIGTPRRYALVFQKPNTTLPFGSDAAIGHDGVGGALAFADPRHEIAFGFVQRRMPPELGVDPRTFELARLARESSTGLD